MVAAKIKSSKMSKSLRDTASRKAKTENAESMTIFGWIEQLSSSRIILLLCLLSSLAYANMLGGDFVFDDAEQIVTNPLIRSWDNLGHAFTTHVWEFREHAATLRVPFPPPYYRPIFTVMLTVEYKLFGLWPQGWHLVSLLMHLLCAIGVYYVLLMISQRKWMAAIAASIFAIHPIHTESVSWISGMTDPLFSLFFLASYYFYLRFRSNKSRISLAVSLIMFAISAFSKETALSLIILIFAYEYIESGANGKAVARSGEKSQNWWRAITVRAIQSATWTLPHLAVALFYLACRYAVLGALTWENPNAHKGSLVHVLLTLPLILWSYIQHLIWPFNLSVVYHTRIITSAASPKFLIPAVLLTLLFGLIVGYRKKLRKEVWHALAMIVIPILPVLNITQLSEEYLLADRYLYLSVMGFGYLIASGFAWMCGVWAGRNREAVFTRRAIRFSPLMLTLLMIILIGGCWVGNRSWADEYSLWSNAARISPTSWSPYYNIGLEQLKVKRYTEALAAFIQSDELAPDEPCVLDSLGRTYDALGNTDKAVEYFRRAIRVDPTMFESYNNLGTIYFKAEDYKTASGLFITALRLKPQATAARFNLGLCYSRLGHYSEAAQELEQVINLAPKDVETYYELGLVYEKAGRSADAATVLQRGLALSGSDSLVEAMSDCLKRVQQKVN